MESTPMLGHKMRTIRSISPLTQETIGCYPIATEEEVNATIHRANKALLHWSRLTPRQRGDYLKQLGRVLAAQAEQLVSTIHQEIGKPLQEVYGAEILPSLSAIKWLEQQIAHYLRPRRLRQVTLAPQPYGVVGIIGTWNYPLWLNLTPILWALAAGNTVVWKPSELATASAFALQSCLEQAELPVFLVIGDAQVGQALCRSSIQKLAFTGSTATGRSILSTLAQGPTPAVMELSGNDASIVTAYADLTSAARCLVWARCCNAGQSCVAPQRIFVHQKCYHEFLTLCQQQMERLQLEQELTPLRTENLRSNLHQRVQAACAQGAELLTGGYALSRTGYFYAPTLVADCTDDMALMQEDLFGPVLAVSSVHSDEEAVERANRSEFTLGVSIWTKDRQHGRFLAQQLRAAVVTINEVELLIAANPAIPFGGWRLSGFGKQRGREGLDEFVVWKAIYHTSPFKRRYHLFPYHHANVHLLRSLVELYIPSSLHHRLQALFSLFAAVRSWRREHQYALKNNVHRGGK
ncbi:aldehyde dehydrogenase family protein [Chthonomonas calidirosea]|uniref:aldehyde dehydrogenase family protein n=1 Tax=Chthonomonas calidirosea TaxID=454171 RepID=UPI0006EC5748|nr:aldehyde dehydrogenase family protein [Chthonomonas calidirosea]CEK14706.1 NAD-dependent aldehyde dehydrogenase [Chthonomonas calidirosea]